MKASDVIKALTDLIEQHGDLPVQQVGDDYHYDVDRIDMRDGLFWLADDDSFWAGDRREGRS